MLTNVGQKKCSSFTLYKSETQTVWQPILSETPPLLPPPPDVKVR